MISDSRPVYWLPIRWCAAGVVVLISLNRVSAVCAEVILSGDPPYPMDAVVFTVDPEGKDTNERGINGVRTLRQTFQNPTTIDVNQIVASINVDGAAVTAGLQVRIFEVEDVLAAPWAAGNLVKQFIIPTVPAELANSSMARLGITLTGSDIFTLPQRNTGNMGYGIEYSNNDGVSNFGLLRHTNTTMTEDYYPTGRYLTETGAGNVARDTGLALAGSLSNPGIPGDVDDNGVVNLLDFDPIRDNFRKPVAGRMQGDLTRDGVVNFSDFHEWKGAFLGMGGSLAGVDLGLLTNVPEPASLALRSWRGSRGANRYDGAPQQSNRDCALAFVICSIFSMDWSVSAPTAPIEWLAFCRSAERSSARQCGVVAKVLRPCSRDWGARPG